MNGVGVNMTMPEIFRSMRVRLWSVEQQFALGEFAANRAGGAALRRPTCARLGEPLGWMG